MPDIPVVDVAGHLPTDLMQRPELWPAGPQRSGAHTNAQGLSAFASRSEYASPIAITVTDSEHRLHLSVWLRDGVDVDAEGLRMRIEGRQTVAGFMPGARWTTRFVGEAHHVGLLLHPECLKALAGEEGEAFFDALRRDGGLRVAAGDARTLRAARELEEVLLAPDRLALLREAKSLELLACLIEDCRRQASQAGTLPRQARERLQHARDRLLSDIADPPTLQQLADECGLNTFALKRGFKQLFGEPVFVLLQRERMRRAWELIAVGGMSAAEAGSQVGYCNMSHFGAAFRRAHGMLPGEVRRRSRVADMGLADG
ncbi:AraC family transcriptional regulator [Delftia sp. UME58]|uniref:helix-turn-helix domain-containing protein n=1 Tax=Delftia sp. UME58 TaxID=1862322 RepID=UPI001600E920|nr:AraC family transcriptional regulator [Delftia sp. UME58]MBB1648938.1 hypothetical protein [Delftia sp. UME58]